jgi:hypothetical protein
MSNFLTNLARRGSGSALAIVPRAPYGSEAPAAQLEALDMPDASGNPVQVEDAATLDPADPFEDRIDTSRSDLLRPNHPPPDRPRVSFEPLSSTQQPNAAADVRRIFENRPLSISPTASAADEASFADRSDPDPRPAGKPTPATTRAPMTSPALPPALPVECVAAAKLQPANLSSTPAPRIADGSATRPAPSPSSVEVTPVPQAVRKTQGAQSGPAPAHTETPSIRVTIGRVDIRASSPPQAPHRSPSLKESKGFGELRLSRGHLGRNYV